MYCPNCATQIQTDLKFCTRCGINLTTVTDLIHGRIIESPKSAKIIKLLEKCHNGYLSTVIGLGLIITSLLIIIAAMMIGVIPAAISGIVILGWAIPAIARGVAKWQSARSEMRSIMGVKGEEESGKSLPTEYATTDSVVFAGSVTEGTTASLEQRA